MATIITTDEFKSKIFDFEKDTEWAFKGNKPAVIDFYADWCGPCKMIAPIIEELSKEYDGKIDIYKVNTEDEQHLASAFGIKSIPSILFIPLNGKPRMTTGAMTKAGFKNAFKEFLNIE